MACLVTRHETCCASRMTVNPRPCTASLQGGRGGGREDGRGREGGGRKSERGKGKKPTGQKCFTLACMSIPASIMCMCVWCVHST